MRDSEFSQAATAAAALRYALGRWRCVAAGALARQWALTCCSNATWAVRARSAPVPQVSAPIQNRKFPRPSPPPRPARPRARRRGCHRATASAAQPPPAPASRRRRGTSPAPATAGATATSARASPLQPADSERSRLSTQPKQARTTTVETQSDVLEAGLPRPEMAGAASPRDLQHPAAGVRKSRTAKEIISISFPNIIEINKIFVYRTVARQKPSLTVLYGSFSDRGAAQDALANAAGVAQGFQADLAHGAGDTGRDQAARERLSSSGQREFVRLRQNERRNIGGDTTRCER